MNVKLYSIFDAQLASYAQPFFAQTHGHAIRMFGDHVRDPATTPNKHPQDFALYHLGDFDDQTGTIVPRTTPERLSGASEHLQPDKQLDITEAIARKNRSVK